MFRCKVITMLLLLSVLARANVTKRAKNHIEIGLGYADWNERLDAVDAGIRQSGYAGYGGFVFQIESNWSRHRWHWGWNSGFGIGKASAGGFATTYNDGRDRPWFLATASPFIHYRLTHNFMVGGGGLIRYRGADWTALDKTIEFDSGTPIQVTGSIDIRWTVTRWSLIQNFAPLNSAGDTIWQWSIQYAL